MSESNKQLVSFVLDNSASLPREKLAALMSGFRRLAAQTDPTAMEWELLTFDGFDNVPNENIQRTIKKFTDNSDINFEEITYEGYGPSGVAIIVEASTDNRNRTAGNVRAWFNKYGGNMGQNGCVGYLFEEKGVITIVDEDGEIDEDKIMEDALECGAEDIKCDEGEYTIYTATDDLSAVRDAIIALGYKIDTADVAKVPSTYVELTSDEDIENMEKMLEKFNEDDDVNAVYTNWDN